MSSVAAHVVGRECGVFRDVRSASSGIVRTVLGLAERVGPGGERHAER
jgi:hypothetical protein